MKLLAVLFLVAAWVTSSDSVTCDERMTCLEEMSKLSDAKHEESCRILANIKDCVHEALDDCRRNSTLPISEADTFAEFVMAYDKKCGSGAGTASQTVSIFLLLLLHCSILLLF